MPETRTVFSNLVTAILGGRNVDAPSRSNDWITWEPTGELATLKPDLYGGAEIVISQQGPGTVRIKALRSSTFMRDTVPYLVKKTAQEGGFSVTINDPNPDTRMTLTCDKAVLSRVPSEARGAPDLSDAEVEVLGVWLKQ